MAKTNTEIVPFVGIERINKGITCNEGACEEIINLRKEGNSWVNCKHKKPTGDILPTQSDNYDIYKHSASSDKYFIVHDKDNNCVILYKKMTLNLGGNTVQTGRDDLGEVNLRASNYAKAKVYSYEGETIISVSFIQSVMIICTDARKYFYIYENELYSDINISSANEVFLKCVSLKETDNRDPNNENKITSVDNNPLYFVNLENKSQEEATPLIIDAVKAFFSNQDKSYADTYEMFRGLSFYRVAVRLYDGSYTNYSMIGYAGTNGDDHFSDGSWLYNMPLSCLIQCDNNNRFKHLRTIATYSTWGQHKAFIRFKDYAAIKRLMDNGIVKSVDLFMTRPISDIDWNSVKFAFSDHEMNEDMYTEDVRYFRQADGLLKTDLEKIKQEITNGIYYKVKSFDKTSVFNDYGNGYLEYQIKAKDIENLESKETLPTPNISHEILYTDSYLYNQKQHLFGLTYNSFEGYELINTERNAVSRRLLYLVLEGEINGMKFVRRKRINNSQNFVYVQDGKTYITLPKLYGYPTNNKIKLKITSPIAGNASREHLLFSSEGDDGMVSQNLTTYQPPVNKFVEFLSYFYFDEYFNLDRTISVFKRPVNSGAVPTKKESLYPIVNEEASFVEIKKIEEIPTVQNLNVLQLSRMNNPFVLPNEENYQFGDMGNKIIAIATTCGNISSEKFGEYPLYVFCTDGIYSMQVGSGDIAYSNIIKMNDTRITNKNVAEVGDGVFFSANTGLCLVQGRQVLNVSRQMNGTPELTVNSLYAKLKQQSVKHIVQAAVSNVADLDFIDEIKNAEMFFDSRHNELNICTDKYTYVYNIEYNNFYKRADTYRVVKNSSCVFKENYLVYIYDKDEELATDSTTTDKEILIITKPFMLKTRQYKKIRRFITSLSVPKDSNLSITLFGTYDCKNYRTIKHWERDSTGMDLQDIYLSNALGSFKYGVIAIASRKLQGTRITHCIFEFDIVRASGGIK